MITFGSLFTGIGGFDLGFIRAGMKCSWQVEIDEPCLTVLNKHFPDIEKHKDVNDVGKRNLKPVDLICGGFPCQDLSIAGKRKGLAGERSGLWFEFHRIVEEIEPIWVVIENVPGLLSSNGGKDFAIILRGLVKLRYGVSWRILDSQYFGVPQRRRRVFIVGSLGNGSSAEVLFEQESCTGNTSKGRETRKRTALSPEEIITSTLGGFGHGWQEQHNDTNAVVTNVVDALQSRDYKGVGNQYVNENKLITSFNWQSGGDVRLGFGKPSLHSSQTPAVTSLEKSNMVGVRRLTPRECERLQAFPDDWTAGQSDSARYRQLGNAVTVSVIEWIGKRICKL